MEPEVIYIVAGNLHQFAYYKQKKWKAYQEQHTATSQPFPDYRYVRNVNSIRGIRNIKGFYIGTFDQRTDYQELVDTINSLKR